MVVVSPAAKECRCNEILYSLIFYLYQKYFKHELEHKLLLKEVDSLLKKRPITNF